MTRLISITDFTNNKYLSQNLDARDVDPVIDEAQEFDLKPVLGRELYLDFINNLSDAKYQDLLNGKEYTPTGYTNPVKFVGVKEVLKYYIYARMVLLDGVKNTNSGFVQKTLENSTRLSGTQRTQMIAQARSGARAYEDEMVFYLNNFYTTYTLWKCSVRKNQGFGFRIKAI